MPSINVLIKPASGSCNLKCEYCFYCDTMEKRTVPSYGVMSTDILEMVIKQVLGYAESFCTIGYQGGEPALCGLDFFRKSIELQKKYNKNHVHIQNTFQTNGYLLDKKWAEFLKENNFLVGISLDGVPEIHDAFRKTKTGQGSFYKVMENIKILQEIGVDFNILSVVTKKNAAYIRENYDFYRKNRLRYLQFIACLEPFGEEAGHTGYSLTPELYGSFLIELFDLWYEDLQRGEQPYIRQFENYIGMLLGKMPEECDMRGICSLQYVVEADGSVYPCDFYALDEWRIGSFCENTIQEMDMERKKKGFIEKSVIKGSYCEDCRYKNLCRGGCRRTRYADEGTHQYFCKSYQMFFDACLPRLKEIARVIGGGY